MPECPRRLQIILLRNVQEEVEVAVLDEGWLAFVLLHVGFEVGLGDFLAAAGWEVGVLQDAEPVVGGRAVADIHQKEFRLKLFGGFALAHECRELFFAKYRIFVTLWPI